jgi:prepilin-type N-terminal cleavage/methylation domain-containing protein
MSSFISKLQARLAKEESGFTLIELLIVLVIIGILLAIAVPSYLGFKDRANQTAATANLRSAVPAVETYFSDNDTYVGMTVAKLQLIDQGVKMTVEPADLGVATYCIKTIVGGKSAWKAGPAAEVVTAKPAGCTA